MIGIDRHRHARLGRRAAVLCAVALASVSGSPGAKVEVLQKEAPFPAVEGSRLVLLPPEIVYEDEATELRLDPAPFAADRLAERIEERVRREVGARGVSVHRPDADGYPPPSRMVRSGRLPDGVCATTGAAASGRPVLAIHARVIVGSRGSWNPGTGAITSASHRTRLRAALVDCRTSRTLWRNEVVLRQVPDPKRPGLDKAIDRLFGESQTRPVGEEQP